MFSKVNTAVCIGVEGKPVIVETEIFNGLPGINIVGLASTTIMEAKERIKTAIINSDYLYPKGRIIVNLTPAHFRKNGSCLDLPIAIGVLTSSLYINEEKVEEYGIIGELSLDGKVLGVDSVLPMALAMIDNGINKIIVPSANYSEALLMDNIEVIPVSSLYECVEIINGNKTVEVMGNNIEAKIDDYRLDFSDIRGQENAKRAICIAVAGRHGLLMIGSPGCGKSMLAKRIPTIMPHMTKKELIETAIINSVVGKNNREKSISVNRPFRSPHTSIGKAGLLGGGMIPIPGEISLAHNGVLFLDEVCEFDRENIESLRIPVEEKKITHFRSGIPYTFPCNFQLIMASNPCKCGYYGDNEILCKCTEAQVEQYRKKLSGPMMDRIDLKIQMERVNYKEISSNIEGMSSKQMKEIVDKGVGFAKLQGRGVANGDMNDAEIKEYCTLNEKGEAMMKQAYDRLKLSPRSYKKILKVARTIADIEESNDILEKHLAEAISYRME